MFTLVSTLNDFICVPGGNHHLQPITKFLYRPLLFGVIYIDNIHPVIVTRWPFKIFNLLFIFRSI